MSLNMVKLAVIKISPFDEVKISISNTLTKMFLQRLKVEVELRKLDLELQLAQLEAFHFDNVYPVVGFQYDVAERINEELELLERILSVLSEIAIN